MGGKTLSVALACHRSALRRSWRQATVLALIIGILGAVALGSLAGARRTATAYDRYLTSINASDAFVNVPGVLPGMPVTRPIDLISALPGVISHATYVGLNAFPVLHGKVDYDFLTASINGSLDGEYFSQDRASVVAGALPPPDSTTTVVLTPGAARAFGVGVGDTMRYQFSRRGPQGQQVGKPVIRSFRVAAIAEIPPALVDQSDEAEGTILPPGATRQLLSAYFYAWIGLRLADGTAGIPRLQQQLATLANRLERQIKAATGQKGDDLSFTINRTDVVERQVRQAITPEVIALSVFGAIAAVAMLVLAGQGLAQLVGRRGPDIAVLRALGATRGQAALAAGLPGAIAVLGGTVLAVAGAIALSPLAPVGPVRRFDPSRGMAADPLVLGAGAVVCAVLLLGLLTMLAVRTASRRGTWAGPRSSALARAAAAAGLPATVVVGTRNALEPGRSVPVRSALVGAIAAVTAVVSAVVFNASLAGLITHPARYGWNWDTVIQAESGYGSFNPGVMKKLLAGQQAVGAWSEFAFTQLPVDGKFFPVLGVRHDLGSIQPPTTAGRPLTGGNQIELGTVTLAALGKKIGDTVRIGIAPYTRTAVITGTVTLPSFGIGGAEHVSLGRGAMLPEATLLAVTGATTPAASANQAIPAFPSAVAIDWAPGSTAAQRAALIHRVTSANPDGTPGGTYEMRSALASAVINTEQMGGQPLALGIGLAAAAVLSRALTVLSLVRRRRHELALLKIIGMTRGQIRAVIAWQTTLTLLIAVVVGGPLGVVGGRLAWRAFAGSLGVAPIVEVPLAVVVVGLVVLVLAGDLLAALPAAVAARTRAAVELRAE
ncbi:MAG TPA: FtsX-like permease family protein [Streptosporangiaceae bacterium]